MSKNLIVLFIIILLVVGGFGIYTYDQSNQAKKEVEEKNFELESKSELISELKENIQEKEKQIDELKASLPKEEKDLEKEYADKLSELTEEKAKLEVLLAEKEETFKTIKQQKEESEQIVFSKGELISELKENIQEKEKQIDELKASLPKEEKDLEKEYAIRVSELMEEKGQLEALLIEQEGILQTKDREKEELISKLENCNNQINELKDKLVQQEIEEEKDYVAELSALTEEKSKLENQLKIYQDLLSEKEDTIVLIKQKDEESERNIVEKDKTIAELSESIRGYENLVTEMSEQQAAKEKEKETEYSNKLSLLSEEKSKLETQLKVSQELLSEKESIITVFKQQNEESKV
jgi:chromosome segregation ATPase